MFAGHCPQIQIQEHTNTNETANTHTNTNTIQGHQASHKSWQVPTRKGQSLLGTALKYKYKFMKIQLKLQIQIKRQIQIQYKGIRRRTNHGKCKQILLGTPIKY